MRTINPSNGKIIEEYAYETNSEIETHIRDAVKAQRLWRKTEFNHRSAILYRLAELLENNKQDLAEHMALEMGKPVTQGISETVKCAWVCRYYAEHAEDFLRDEPADIEHTKSYVTFNPLGVILSIMPWNYPLWQVLRFAAPSLMAGNAVLLKHADNTTGCALRLQELFDEAGVPRHLFTTILASHDQLEQVIADPDVAAVTLTGSTRAGKAVASLAGKALKKTVLELGGSDPYLILEDADLELAAEQCVRSRLLNSGQSCIAAKRFIVVDEVYDEFRERVIEKMKMKKLGDPFREDTDVGPMARKDLRDELHRQVTDSLEAGATALMGCELTDGEGAYYPVSMLENVRPGMPAYEEELFGPVASLIRVNDETEAIRVANDTSFGLGACVFSRNIERAETIAAQKLEAGCCFVNTFVKSDPRLPFGGIKSSGYGRELGLYGIREFVNTKTVWVGSD